MVVCSFFIPVCLIFCCFISCVFMFVHCIFCLLSLDEIKIYILYVDSYNAVLIVVYVATSNYT